MEVVFRNQQLRRRYEQSAEAIREWGPDVGRKYIIRVNELLAVGNFQEARKIRSMRLHPLKGSKKGDWSIRLTGKWRLIVKEGDTEEQVVVREVSNHYDD